MIKTTRFLTELGLEVTTPQLDKDKMKSCNVTEASVNRLVAKSDGRFFIRVGDVRLERIHMMRQRTRNLRRYQVWRMDGIVPVELLGTMDIMIRPVSKQALVVLEPAK